MNYTNPKRGRPPRPRPRLANDDPNQILTGASQRIYHEAGTWKLVIEATMFVTYAVVNV